MPLEKYRKMRDPERRPSRSGAAMRSESEKSHAGRFCSFDKVVIKRG